jgi:hypothetical protein
MATLPKFVERGFFFITAQQESLIDRVAYLNSPSINYNYLISQSPHETSFFPTPRLAPNVHPS